MATAKKKGAGDFPPYITYGAFKSALEKLGETVLPTRFDRHVLHWMSGNDFSALISGLKFLDLVNGENRPMELNMDPLIDSLKTGPAEYRSVLKKLLETHYEPIIGDFDLSRGTLSELQQRFRDFGLSSPQMVMKCIRFYLKALQDAGVTVSDHIMKPRKRSTPRATGGGARTKKVHGRSKKEQVPPGLPDSTADVIPNGYERIPIPGMQQAHIQYPTDMTADHIKLFQAAVKYLEAVVDFREVSEGGGAG